MQETEFNGQKIREYFTGKDDEETLQKMEARLTELRAQGHTLSRRVKIGRNDPCPCESGKKFKKCCLDSSPGRRSPAAMPDSA